MRIARARVTPLRLLLRTPVETAHGRITAREGALVDVVGEDGLRGCGEALPLPGFGLETAREARGALVEACRALLDDGFELGRPLAGAVREALARAPSARAAVETALADLHARSRGVSLASHLADPDDAVASVATGALVTGDTPRRAAEAAHAARGSGFTTLKLKLGAAAFGADLERLTAVREAVPDAALRLDAGAAWTESEAIANVARLAPLDVELLEQPVAADAIDALARVREHAPFPIAADEAVRDLPSAKRLLAAGAADVLVLKPAALGGPRQARRIADAARAAGVEVLVTSFLDSAIGRGAALQLAASLPPGRHAHGLATGALLKRDLARLAEPAGGKLALPKGPGLGVVPDAEALGALGRGATEEIHR